MKKNRPRASLHPCQPHTCVVVVFLFVFFFKLQLKWLNSIPLVGRAESHHLHPVDAKAIIRFSLGVRMSSKVDRQHAVCLQPGGSGDVREEGEETEISQTPREWKE